MSYMFIGYVIHEPVTRKHRRKDDVPVRECQV